MRRVWLVKLGLVLALAVGCAGLPGLTEEAYAATGAAMKSLKVKWDLKKNRTVAVSTAWKGVGVRKAAAKVTGFKVGASDKKSYRKAVFTVTFFQRFKPSKKQVHQIARLGDVSRAAGFASFVLVDYRTGKELGAYNNKGVTIKTSGWRSDKLVTYRDADGCWVRYPTKYSMKVVITFPRDYRDLCLGIIGNRSGTETKVDDAFWNSYEPFGKTTYYKSGKSNSHWMRIR